MKKVLTFVAVLVAGFGVPALALAQPTFFSLLIGILVLINWLVPVVMGLAILLFLWGLMRYILQTDSVEGKEAARNTMVWGIVAIFVMVSLWGFVNLLEVITGVNAGTNPLWPQL